MYNAHMGGVDLLDALIGLYKLHIRSKMDEHQAVTFASLMPIPHRERPRGKSARKRPPAYNLASDEHYEYVKQKASVENKAKPKGKSATPKGRPAGSSGLKPSANTCGPKQKLPKKCQVPREKLKQRNLR